MIIKYLRRLYFYLALITHYFGPFYFFIYFIKLFFTVLILFCNALTGCMFERLKLFYYYNTYLCNKVIELH